MKLFAVVGNPIYFSRSPEIFSAFFQHENIDAKYFRLSADTAEEAINLFNELGLSGMSVTAPFKTDIIPFLDDIDDLAKAIGSINTVVRKDNKLIGYNTDYYGIVNTLPEVKNKNILVLGAGGASKAVVYSLKKQGANIKIINRTAENAEQLANNFDVDFAKIENLKHELESADIIVNTLPSGIKIIEDNWIQKNHIFFDAIYHNSSYRDIAKEKDITFYSGKTWLVNQAKEAFKLFFGKEIDIDDTCFSEEVKPREKLIFIGFMGSGKSTIGKQVADKMGVKFFSTDHIIETKEGQSINSIFEQHSEEYFRKTENEILNMLSSMAGSSIISTGGGVVLSEANRKLISENYKAVWLYANVDSIMHRTAPENRPLLKDNFTKERVQELMDMRFNFYAESADFVINTSDKTISEIIDKLVKIELKGI